MISLSVLFWIYVIMFALIGAMRGWAKEVLVTSGVIVALFLVTILETFVPILKSMTTESKFWVRLVTLILMVFFGYQSPKFPRNINSGKFVRDRFEDTLLGSVVGAFNGYMIFGTAWFYLMEAGYPFAWITPRIRSPSRSECCPIDRILPPQWLNVPLIYIAVAVAIVLVLVVFI